MNKCGFCGRRGHKKPTCPDQRKKEKTRRKELHVPEGFSLKRSSKVTISQGELDMAARVLLGCYKEAQDGMRGSPLKRAAELTGLGLDTMKSLKKTLAGGNCPVSSSARGKWVRSSTAADRNILTKINDTVDKLHAKGVKTTVKKIQEKLNFHHGLIIRKTLLGSLLHKLGYSYTTPSANHTILAKETNATLKMRLEYVNEIGQKRQENEKTVVYNDESYVNERHTAARCWVKDGSQIYIPQGKGRRYILIGAGSKNGWLYTQVAPHKGGTSDYHDSMNAQHFEEVFLEICNRATDQLGACVMLMDNASYHKTPKDPGSRISHWSAMPAREIINMWAEGKVTGQENYTGPPLTTKKSIMEWLRANRSTGPSKVGAIAAEHGHEVLLLPPYHPELNAIETAWGVLKNHVADRNDPTHKFKDLDRLIQDGIEKSTVDTWIKLDQKVIENEKTQQENLQTIFDRQAAFREAHPDLMFQLTAESSGESDLEDEPIEDATDAEVLNHLADGIDGDKACDEDQSENLVENAGVEEPMDWEDDTLLVAQSLLLLSGTTEE